MALPRSINTTTPSSDHTSSMAASTWSASVPMGSPGSSSPPGGGDGGVATHLPGQLSHPLGDRALCDTRTMPDHGQVKIPAM